MLTKKELSYKINEHLENLLQRGDKQDVVKILYKIQQQLNMSFDLDYVDSGEDDYVQATVYINNLMGNGAGYNVILDVDFDTRYETKDEVVDELMRLETAATNMLEKFRTHKLIKAIHEV